jgi:hypothetical protein
MRDVAHPTRARPPLVCDDTPPALYALIHSSKHSHRNTPPSFSKSNTPGVYIFSFKHLRTFSLSFKLTLLAHSTWVGEFIKVFCSQSSLRQHLLVIWGCIAVDDRTCRLVNVQGSASPYDRTQKVSLGIHTCVRQVARRTAVL